MSVFKEVFAEVKIALQRIEAQFLIIFFFSLSVLKLIRVSLFNWHTRFEDNWMVVCFVLLVGRNVQLGGIKLLSQPDSVKCKIANLTHPHQSKWRNLCTRQEEKKAIQVCFLQNGVIDMFNNFVECFTWFDAFALWFWAVNLIQILWWYFASNATKSRPLL